MAHLPQSVPAKGGWWKTTFPGALGNCFNAQNIKVHHHPTLQLILLCITIVASFTRWSGLMLAQQYTIVKTDQILERCGFFRWDPNNPRERIWTDFTPFSGDQIGFPPNLYDSQLLIDDFNHKPANHGINRQLHSWAQDFQWLRGAFRDPLMNGVDTMVKVTASHMQTIFRTVFQGPCADYERARDFQREMEEFHHRYFWPLNFENFVYGVGDDEPQRPPQLDFGAQIQQLSASCLSLPYWLFQELFQTFALVIETNTTNMVASNFEKDVKRDIGHFLSENLFHFGNLTNSHRLKLEKRMYDMLRPFCVMSDMRYLQPVPRSYLLFQGVNFNLASIIDDWDARRVVAGFMRSRRCLLRAALEQAAREHPSKAIQPWEVVNPNTPPSCNNLGTYGGHFPFWIERKGLGVYLLAYRRLVSLLVPFKYPDFPGDRVDPAIGTFPQNTKFRLVFVSFGARDIIALARYLVCDPVQHPELLPRGRINNAPIEIKSFPARFLDFAQSLRQVLQNHPPSANLRLFIVHCVFNLCRDKGVYVQYPGDQGNVSQHFSVWYNRGVAQRDGNLIPIHTVQVSFNGHETLYNIHLYTTNLADDDPFKTRRILGVNELMNKNRRTERRDVHPPEPNAQLLGKDSGYTVDVTRYPALPAEIFVDQPQRITGIDTGKHTPLYCHDYKAEKVHQVLVPHLNTGGGRRARRRAKKALHKTEVKISNGMFRHVTSYTWHDQREAQRRAEIGGRPFFDEMELIRRRQAEVVHGASIKSATNYYRNLMIARLQFFAVWMTRRKLRQQFNERQAKQRGRALIAAEVAGLTRKKTVRAGRPGKDRHPDGTDMKFRLVEGSKARNVRGPIYAKRSVLRKQHKVFNEYLSGQRRLPPMRVPVTVFVIGTGSTGPAAGWKGIRGYGEAGGMQIAPELAKLGFPVFVSWENGTSLRDFAFSTPQASHLLTYVDGLERPECPHVVERRRNPKKHRKQWYCTRNDCPVSQCPSAIMTGYSTYRLLQSSNTPPGQHLIQPHAAPNAPTRGANVTIFARDRPAAGSIPEALVHYSRTRGHRPAWSVNPNFVPQPDADKWRRARAYYNLPP